MKTATRVVQRGENHQREGWEKNAKLILGMQKTRNAGSFNYKVHAFLQYSLTRIEGENGRQGESEKGSGENFARENLRLHEELRFS